MSHMILQRARNAFFHRYSLKKFGLGLLFIVAITGLYGCSSNDKNKTALARLSEQGYYEAAQKAMNKDNYLLAIEQLEQLDLRHPFGVYGERAQLDLAYAYYKTSDYDSAKEQADRFIRLHRQHPQTDYAYYIKGLSAYNASRSVFDRFLPVRIAERDITPAQDAFIVFKELVSRYPDSAYAADARQRMIYLRNLLAEHELAAATYYMKREAYLAAVNRGRYIVENYQGTPTVADALVVMVRAYRALDLSQLADTSEAVLAKNFPNHPALDPKTQRVKTDNRLRNEDRSWLNIVSFGLF